MVHPGGFEPPTARFVAEYSIQLSYGCKMAVRRGFEPRMQLLTAYSLSRGAPSASRPPHHTPLTSASKNLFLLIVAAWRTYYFLGLISQTIFQKLLSFAQITRNSHVKAAKRVFYKRILQASSQKTYAEMAVSGRVKGNGVVKKRAIEIKR